MPSAWYPPNSEPVEPFLWVALLVGREVDVPCDFASSPSWPCMEVNLKKRRCPALPKDATAEDRARHSAEHGSSSVSCNGPAICLADVMAYVTACPAHTPGSTTTSGLTA